MGTLQDELAARTDALFKHTRLPIFAADQQELPLRLSAVNQFDGGAVPKFYLLRSSKNTIWRARADQPAALVAQLAAVVAKEQKASLAGAKTQDWQSQFPHQQSAFEKLLAASAYRLDVSAGPVYRFPDDLQGSPHVTTQLIDGQNQHQLAAYLSDWQPDVAYRAPLVGAMVGQQVVAICASVRISSANGKSEGGTAQVTIHEAGVATAPSFQRRGYAAAVVASWAEQVRSLGASPYYSTQWSNVASQQLAAKLNLERVATEYHLT